LRSSTVLASSTDVEVAASAQTIWSSDNQNLKYIDVLGDSIFCPVPEGVAGWSSRLVDAIYAGCVPDFIGQSAQRPFHDRLDWFLFSVTLEREDLQRVESDLLGYTMEQVERMQRDLMLIRDAFMYPLDAQHEKALGQRGPMWFAMPSSSMRLMTSYPGPMVIDRPDGLL